MFCCWSPPVFQDTKPLIVDLAEVLNEMAWRSFLSCHGPLKRMLLKRKDYDIEVPENYFDFEDIDQIITPSKKFTIRSPGDKSTPSETGPHNDGTDRSGLLKGKISPSRELTNPEYISLDTEFRNETAEQQLYKFRFEKTRRTEIEVTFQKGITIGGKASFSIGIPFGEAEAETEVQYEVTKSEGQKFEETMVMEATSDIAVGPNSCYTANVQLEERNLHATFKIISRMSMPQDGQKVFVYYVSNLIDTFVDSVPCAQIVKGEDGSFIADKLDFMIEGVVKGSLACNHKIALTSNESADFKNQAKDKYLNDIKERRLDRRDHM
ncbi:unnamed protein product [Candidula unifasciata]|uniref:Uncharacterized protein n=1 Tax=Candidula unifasciata TaxID=100452 RepID=A0A8S3ZPN5_9EUPU|nr:unnamed protein product [Candidula unifasciata]